MSYTIAALYRFVTIEDPAALCERMKADFRPLGLLGTLQVADEGINGTLSGSSQTIAAFIDLLVAEVGLVRADVKYSVADENPFDRLKVRVRREIITFKQLGVDPSTQAGTYVEPRDWNALIAQPDVLLIDTRNAYETEVGTFAGAVDPGLEHFSHFADYVRQKLDPARHKRVAMFCTGGIRCEKASAFMRLEGFGEVYHLRGGILKYLEEIPATDSRWQGQCFVFDARRAVGHEDFATDE